MSDVAVDPRLEERKALAEAHPDTWIPVEPGERVTGKVIDVTQAWSDVMGNTGGFYPLLTLELEDGTTKKVHAFSTVIYQEVMSKKPEIGETVTFSYEGKGEVKKVGRNAPNLYRLYVAGRPNMASSVYGSIQDTQPGARFVQSDQTQQPPAPANGQQTPQNDDIPF